MIEPHTLIRAYLAAKTGITTLTGARIYVGRNVPPEGYKISDGACLVVNIRGGAWDYENALVSPSVQIKCYASTEVAAYTLYRALTDALHSGYSATILHAEAEGLGSLLKEPGTDWPFVLGFFTIMLKTS